MEYIDARWTKEDERIRSRCGKKVSFEDALHPNYMKDFQAIYIAITQAYKKSSPTICI